MSAPSAARAVPDDQLLSVTAVRGDRPGRVLVDVTGEVDSTTAPLLRLCLDSQTAQQELRELVVDLAEVTVLGPAGVTVLTRAHRRCRRRGARLVLRCAGRRTVLDQLQVTRLGSLVGDAPTLRPDR
ncbi:MULTISPECIES: STAS domain-containing protein [unclassified Modestobacter]|uniref:STAS domain-containing protein n=1 Tax=unclassified Modestobacter TaxID=2643866 RepID=UPI0022AAFD28|nr:MULTISPECIES: STAS domain-containing protein [unclassified Modestobacter]MCZ2812322.1 STAS domain-containing protein [Modestobacter sp. VKM Ac-2979]MCZ2841212.1 STAS domain-containing protein [Modestobacter sp. VKM Ac-2980]MCZ2848494.1 STAS domain-containing protein [Modestobacter sp. VKM Ac-2978]